MPKTGGFCYDNYPSLVFFFGVDGGSSAFPDES